MQDDKYIKVYGWMFDLDLNLSEIMIYAIIYSFCQSGNSYTGSADYLVKLLDLDSRTVRRILKNLTEREYLIKQKSAGKTKSIYFINSDKNVPATVTKMYQLDTNSDKNVSTTVTKMHPNSDKNVPATVTKMYPNNNNINNNNINNNNINNLAVDVGDDIASKVFNCYMQNIGMLSPIEIDLLKDDLKTYPAEWIIEAIHIAVKNQARRYRYIEGILKNWRANGKNDYVQRKTGTNAKRRKVESIEDGARKWEKAANDRL